MLGLLLCSGTIWAIAVGLPLFFEAVTVVLHVVLLGTVALLVVEETEAVAAPVTRITGTVAASTAEKLGVLDMDEFVTRICGDEEG
jgi:hypothetical protein